MFERILTSNHTELIKHSLFYFSFLFIKAHATGADQQAWLILFEPNKTLL